MRYTIRILAVGVILSAGSSFAQESAPEADPAVPPPTAGTQTDSAVQPSTGEATGAIAEPIDADAALAAINATGDMADQASAITSVSKVNVVRLSEIGGADATLAPALQANEASASRLRTAFQANAALSAQLTEAGVQPESIVAARIEADGAVTVFVR